MKLIFVVEDHDIIRNGVKSYLEAEKYSVITFSNLKTAGEALEVRRPDLLIQDVMLPDGDGFEFIGEVKKKWDIPVIFMTAKIAEEDRIRGFELGADDYVTKPFSPKELVLRVQALFRRLDSVSKKESGNVLDRIKFSNGENTMVYDSKNHSVSVNGKKIPFTSAEMKVLNFLIANVNSMVSRAAILEKCFDYAPGSYSRIADTHIKNIRLKLGAQEWIETERGWGYGFMGQVIPD